jgi:hypothetical protein
MRITRKAVGRKSLYIGTFTVAAIIILAIILIHLQPQYFYYTQKRTIPPIVKSERSYLAAQLAPLGITLSQPSKVSCGWSFDPELYSAECDQRAYVYVPAYKVADAGSIEQKINTLDVQLTEHGWVHGANDYRNHGPWASWPVMLQQGLMIGYDNSKDFEHGVSCDLQVSIRANTEITYGSTFNELYCGTTTSYFLLQTPKNLN